MKKSKKLLAFLLSTFMICAVPAVISGCGDDDSQGGTDITQPEDKDAVKVKDAEAISVEAGKTSKIKVSDYITANGNKIEASSSNTAIVTANESGGEVTVTGVAKGGANVIIKCGKISLTFPVTVTQAAVTNPAPKFKDISASLDLREKDFVEVDLGTALVSGGDAFTITYSATLDNKITITGNILKYVPEAVGNRSVTVTAKCTDSKNAQNTYDVTFKVNISVTRSEEEKVYFKVTVDGVENKVEQGKKYTLPEYSGAVPEGKVFDGWSVDGEKRAVGYEITVTADVTVTSVFRTKTYTVTIDGVAQTKDHGSTLTLPEYDGTTPEGKIFDYWTVNGEKKAVGDEITVTADLTVTAVFKTKTYTVSIDGVAQTKEHGSTLTLPAYDKEIESGKQFNGWQVGSEVKAAGSEITITSDLTVTAVIGDVPVTPPEEVKLTDTVKLVLDADAKTLKVSDYIKTNGHAINVNNSAPDIVALSSTATDIVLTAKAFGTATVTITCGSLTATITVNVSYPPSSLKKDEVVDESVHDLFDGELILDLADNITYSQQVTGYKINGVEVEGSNYKVAGNFGETAEEVTYKVTALFDGAEPLEYDYKVTVKDTAAYRIKNGDFSDWENGKPVGWTVTDGYGSEQTATTYWAEERPFDNIGSYFGETNEDVTGTLQSSVFTVGNSGWVTFQLGSANPANNIWVEIVNADGNQVIAKFKNNEWSDPENAQRLIPYKVNLSSFMGESVFIRIIDEQGAGKFGFRTFFADSFNSWYDAEPTKLSADNGAELTFVKLGAPVFTDVTASLDLKDDNSVDVNLPAIAFGVNTQCTYSTQAAGAEINGGVLTFTASKAGVYEITVNGSTSYGNSDFTVTVTVANTKERPVVGDEKIGQINVDTPILSIDKELPAGNDNFSCSYALKQAVDGAEINGNTFTYTASASHEKKTVDVIVIATFTDKTYAEEVYTKEFKLSIEIVGNEPTLVENSVTREIDLNGASEVDVELDLQSNVTIPASVSVTYEVTGADGAVDGSVYKATLGSGTYTLTVKVNYGSSFLEYEYIVKIAQYSVINGDFEDEKEKHLYGWTLTNLDGSEFNVEGIDVVQNSNSYWSGKAAYNNTGYHFNGLDVIPENSTFKLTSSPFTIGGSGYISFKLGGRAAVLKVCDSQTHELLAQYVNSAWADKGEPVGCIGNSNYQLTLIPYFADLSQYMGKKVYLVLEDRLIEGWGHSAMDEVKTYYTEAPTEEKFDTVIDLCGTDGHNSYNINWRKAVCPKAENEYTIANGDFETGDLTGWEVLSGNIYLSGGTSSEVYHDWGEHMPYNKSDEYFCKNAGVAEGADWQLKSSVFTLAEDGNGCISFKMGSHNAIIKVYLADGTQIYEYTCKTYNAGDDIFPHFENGANYITMLTHYADLSEYKGQKMYIVIGNTGESGEFWKFAHFDDIVTYYANGEDLSTKQDQVPLTCTGKDITHEEGATQAVSWIKAENEYHN